VRSDHMGEFLVLSPRQLEISEAPFNVGETAYASWLSHAALALAER